MAPINFLREAMPKQKDKQLKIKGLQGNTKATTPAG